MNITVRQTATGKNIYLSGEWDEFAAYRLENTLADALSSQTARLVVDMNEVSDISSAALRALMAGNRRAQTLGTFIEIVRAQPQIRKALAAIGLGDLMPLGQGTMQIGDLLKQNTSLNNLALQNARRFLIELFITLGIPPDQASPVIHKVFEICRHKRSQVEVEADLKKLLDTLNLANRLEISLQERSTIIYNQIASYIKEGNIIDVGSGDGNIAQAFASNGHELHLIDVVDYNTAHLPFQVYDGLNIPFPNKSFEYSFLIAVLHHCEDPLRVLEEVIRVTRKRIIIIESVYLNEVHRRFNMFFDWFYNRVLHEDIPVPYNFNSPEGWLQILEQHNLKITASVDIGLDQVTVPEYHWLYVADLPD